MCWPFLMIGRGVHKLGAWSGGGLVMTLLQESVCLVCSPRLLCLRSAVAMGICDDGDHMVLLLL